MVTAGRQNDDEEIVIRTSTILNVLDVSIEKIELALCLPVLLKNLDRFASNLSDDDYSALSTCEIYQSPDKEENVSDSEIEYGEKEIKVTPSTESLKSESQTSTEESASEVSAVEDEKPTTNEVEDPNVKKALYILWKRTELVDVIKSEYLHFETESPEFIFLENMHALRQCAYTRMLEDLSPEAERKKIMYYKNIWYKNDEAITKISALKPLLNDVMARAQVELEGKNKVINEMYNRMKNFEMKYNEEIEKLCTDSEKNMVIEIKRSEARQETIHNDIEKLEESFQNTLNGHLKREKELRVKRNKIESQLGACIDSYDNDMRDRQGEYDDILAEYEEEQQQMASLQEKFEEQEKEYTALMEEKAIEDQLLLEILIEDLRRRVAARIIQTHWRALMQRRLERAKSKKARKGKGKKKGGKKGKKGKKPKSPKGKGGPKKSKKGKKT